MHKKILIMLVVLFLTGCNVTYNIEIKDDKILEKTGVFLNESDIIITNADINGNTDSQMSLNEIVDYYYNEGLNAFHNKVLNDSLYKKEKINKDGDVGLRFSYDYNYANYNDSFMVKYCTDNNIFKNDKKYISIDVEDGFDVFDWDVYQQLENLTIKIKTNYKVVENNADSVKGNNYEWIIDRDNYKEKNIHLKIKKNRNIKFSFLPIIIIIGVGVIGVISFYIIKTKHVDNNSF